METRIRQRGSVWIVEYGHMVQPAACGYKPGYYMPAFIVSELHTFTTKDQAVAFIRGRK